MSKIEMAWGAGFSKVMSLNWIAKRLNMGAAGSLPNLLREAKGNDNMRLRGALFRFRLGGMFRFQIFPEEDLITLPDHKVNFVIPDPTGGSQVIDFSELQSAGRREQEITFLRDKQVNVPRSIQRIAEHGNFMPVPIQNTATRGRRPAQSGWQGKVRFRTAVGQPRLDLSEVADFNIHMSLARG